MERSEYKPYPLTSFDYLQSKLYVSNGMYFSTSADPGTISAALRTALAQTIAAFPILAGCIVPNVHAAQKGSMAVDEPYQSIDQILSETDLRGKFNYSDLRQRNFPLDAIDAGVIAPNFYRSPPRVLLAKVSFLDGGLVMFVSAHHRVLDFSGLFNILKVWSAFCRGANGRTLIGTDWLDNTPISDLGDASIPGIALEDTLWSTAGGSQKMPTEKTKSAILWFSDSSLARLKDDMVRGCKVDDSGTLSTETFYPSTNDALCALLWCSIAAARTRLKPGPSCLWMPVDCRHRLSPPLSSNYIGNAVLGSSSVAELSDLTFANPDRLLHAARLVRTSIKSLDNAFVKGHLKMVDSLPDLSQLEFRSDLDISRGVFITSWARSGHYELDWGVEMGGACERFRSRPVPAEGLVGVYPRFPATGDSEGGLEVAVGLYEEDFKHFREDKVLNAYVQWRCV